MRKLARGAKRRKRWKGEDEGANMAEVVGLAMSVDGACRELEGGRRGWRSRTPRPRDPLQEILTPGIIAVDANIKCCLLDLSLTITVM